MCTTNLLALFFLYGQTVVFSHNPTPNSVQRSVTDTTYNEPIEEEKSLPKPEIRTLHVYSDIKYRYATTVVTSRVANVAHEAQEVDFTVVLPETAFISEFLMVIKNKVYKAHVKAKEEAKAEYSKAVSEGRSAAHVEVNARNSNKFTVSVNVEAHGKVDFNLTYEELLTRSLGIYTHIVNLSPGQIVKNMSVTVTINEPANITILEVPDLKVSNEITQSENSRNELANTERPNGQSAVIRWVADPEQQRQLAEDGINGQLVVKYDVDRDTNPQQVLVNEGYFVHFFAPDSLPPLPKFAIFVLDYSGSMGGHKLEQLQDAMKTILSDMDSHDYFSLVLFSYKSAAWAPNRTFVMDREEEYNKPVHISEDNIIPATPDNIKLAIDFLKSYNDLGLTNIISGLRNGLRLADIGKDVLHNTSLQVPEPIIMFLTDGQPNVELDRPHLIIREVEHLNIKSVPIFSLAFGYGADINFLKKLSLHNSGFARTIYEAADASLQLKNFYRQIASPLLSNITFSYLPSQIDNETSSRTHFPLLFSGSELVVVGKLLHPNENNKNMNETMHGGELTGTSSNGTRTFPIHFNHYLPWFPPLQPRSTLHPGVTSTEAPVSHDGNKPSYLEKVWAFLTIKQLLDNAAIQKGDRENATRQKALDLALKYSFVTPVTSLVVVKPNSTSVPVDTETVKPGTNGQRTRVPIDLRTSGNTRRAHQFLSPHGPRNDGLHFIRFNAAPLSDRRSNITSRNRLRVPGVIIPWTTVLPTSAPTAVSAEKLDVNEVNWLLNYTSADKTTINLHIPGTDGYTQFRLGLNESDTVFGHCMTPNGTSGECRLFHHCVLQTFVKQVEDFLPYRCNITSGYLGTCCPLVQIKNHTSS